MDSSEDFNVGSLFAWSTEPTFEIVEK